MAVRIVTFRPDFYDRSGVLLRCRVCGALIDFDPDETGRDPAYLDDHLGEHFGCPGCGVSSRIPTVEESEWPDKKDHDDPMRGVLTTERPRA